MSPREPLSNARPKRRRRAVNPLSRQRWIAPLVTLGWSVLSFSCAGTTFSSDSTEQRDASAPLSAANPDTQAPDAPTMRPSPTPLNRPDSGGGTTPPPGNNPAETDAGRQRGESKPLDGGGSLVSGEQPDAGAPQREIEPDASTFHPVDDDPEDSGVPEPILPPLDIQAIAGVLDGYRIQVPCGAPLSNINCAVAAEDDCQVDSITLGGDPGQRYEVDLLVRGWAEAVNYINGETIADGAYLGGTPDPTRTNRSGFRLSIDSDQYYFLNHRASGNERSAVFDYMFTFSTHGQSSVTLEVNPEPFLPDGSQRINFDAIVPGDDLGPQPYDGQFFQLKLVDVRIKSD